MQNPMIAHLPDTIQAIEPCEICRKLYPIDDLNPEYICINCDDDHEA